MNAIWRNSVFLGLVLLASCQPIAPISYSISIDDEDVVFGLRNNTDRELTVHEMALTDPVGTGHFIFLYDPQSRALAWPNISVYAPPQSLVRSPQSGTDVVLPPGGKLEARMATNAFMGHFIAKKRCYFVVGLYRLRRDGNRIQSSTDVAEYCNPKNPWDP